MSLDTVFAILGIIFGCLLIIMTLGMFVSLAAAKKADRELEEIEQKIRERRRNRK